MSLQETRILVVDDQQEVARTLTRPLREAGASLTFSDNGTDALEKVSGGGYDMLVVDMKMPPGEWGGLWLLEQLQQGGFTLPSIVLSGEGQKRQTVEAMRRGAADWIDKGKADIELPAECAQQWRSARNAAVGRLVATGPSPLAYPYARYRHTVGSERQLDEAFRTLTDVVRFAALIGLATSDAEASGPLRGVPSGSFARPSFGTWVSTVSALMSAPDSSPVFRSLAAQIMPDGRQRWDQVVKLRNDTVGHGSATVSSAQAQEVINLVTACAHRISAARPIRIGSHASMDFDGDTYDVTLRDYTGALPPARSSMTAQTPLRKKSVYAVADGQYFDLSPWFCALESDSGTSTLGTFDSVASRRDGPRNEDVLLYVDTATGERARRRPDHDATWGDVASWFVS